jgi:hypothetical protein
VAESQGDVQALGNGDWFVGWGQLPDFSEFNAQGQLLFDAHLPPGTESYRSFRFPWTATPVHPPAFALQHAAGASGVAYASWNGATQVASWRVLSGSSSRALRPIAAAARAGFETPIPLPGGSIGAYMSVQALDAQGAVIGSSPVRATR